MCPTFREMRTETASPRGRLYLMRALGEGRLAPTDRFAEHVEACLGCRACEAACPSGVEFGHLLEATRAELRARRPAGRPVRLLRWLVFRQLLPQPGRLALFGRLLRGYQRSGLSRLVRPLLPARLRALEELLPQLSARFFDPREIRAGRDESSRCALFAGCVMRLIGAETHRASLALLAQADLAPAAPSGQVCCGALQAHAGDLESARELARRNVAAFESDWDTPIAVNAAGCGAMLKDYGRLLAHDPAYADRARRFSARVRDLSELLADRLPTAEHRPGADRDRAAPGRPTDGSLRVTYQDACHLAHAQRIRAEPRTLLRGLPGVELVELAEADLCCGGAGTYCLTQPEMAGRLLRRKIAAIAASGAQLVVTANPGCLIQLRAGLRDAGLAIEAVHLADLLAARRG